jgi:hypothetical protein
MRRTLTIVCFAAVSSNVFAFTTCTLPAGTHKPSFGLEMAKQKAMPDPEIPPNEFSRPLSTDSILKTAGGKRRVNKDYTIHLEATEEECQALAVRFGLSNIATLEADLSVRRPPEEVAGGGGGSSAQYYSNGLVAVQVEGTVLAKVTQTCVRTNDDFEVVVEFPLSALVKPITHQKQKSEEEEIVLRELKRSGGSSAGKNGVKADSLNNLNDMHQLQRLLQEIKSDEIDNIIEDESIYSGDSGKLDLGELVAQTFWLELDPYPKKPGTDPISFSISG